MKLFHGLYPYESLLLVLGGVLFAVLVFALVWYIVTGKRILVLLPFFLLPVIMIGYPSIESFSYEKGKFMFTKALHQLKEDPANPEIRKAVATSYDHLAGNYHTLNDPAVLTDFAEAQYLLGNYVEARELAGKAVSLRPENQRIRQVWQKIADELEAIAIFKRKISLLETRIQSLESGEADSGATAADREQRRQTKRNFIVRVLADIDPPANIDSESALVLAKALAIAGEKESAVAMSEVVATSSSDTEKAARVRAEILRDHYTTGLPEPEQQGPLLENPALSAQRINQLTLPTRTSANTIKSNQ